MQPMQNLPLRIAAVSDIQGDWDALATVAETQKAGLVVHTGNFGFWNRQTVQNADMAYLKLLVAFLPVLPKECVCDLNNTSLIAGTDSSDADHAAFQDVLHKHPPSHMEDYISGTKTLKCPVYTVVGPLDDPLVVAKFVSGEWNVPNLHVVDHQHAYTVPTGPSLLPVHIYGLGGNVKVHSLFDNGNLGEKAGAMCGRVGDLWITLPQVAELHMRVQDAPKDAVRIFLLHAPVVKTPLLEHVAIVTGAAVTVSQGLHFRYPVLGNGMSFVDSMGGSAGYVENYRVKFLRLRMILGEMWVVVKEEVERLLETDPAVRRLVEVGLGLFDKIPVTVGESIDRIVPLAMDLAEDEDIGRLTLKRINDMYFAAYYNLWHFNLCDHRIVDEENSDYNVMVFALTASGYFRLEHCNGPGFRVTDRSEKEEGKDDDEAADCQLEKGRSVDWENDENQDDLNQRSKDAYKYKTRGQVRGRGARPRGKRGRGRLV